MMEGSLIFPHRDAVMCVIDTWEASSPEEKQAPLQLFLHDVELKMLYRGYESNKEKLLADLQIIQRLHSLLQPQRMKHEKVFRALLDETRAEQGILKIQLLMADLLSSGGANEMTEWMVLKMKDAGTKKDISRYLRRSKLEEESLLGSLEMLGAKVEILKKAKRKCFLIKAETIKDRRVLKKIYMGLEKKLTFASSQHAKLCETKLPFERYGERLRRCLWKLQHQSLI